MKKSRLDNLGRIVIPVQYRRELMLVENSELCISCQNRSVIITPINNVCRLCGKEIDINSDIVICKSCIQKIKEL